MAQLLGLANVLRNLNRRISKVENRSEAGLVKGAILIMNDTENTSPLTPVDTGNLRASRFIATSNTIEEGKAKKFKGERSGELSSDHRATIQSAKSQLKKFKKIDFIGVRLGFTANYAFFVHEMVGVSDIRISKKKQISPLSQAQRRAFGVARFKRPGSGAKFLEASLKRNAGGVLKIIVEEAKIR